jgi:hypothetical protein
VKDAPTAALTSDTLVRAYQEEASRQKLLIKKAELTQGRLMFVIEAFRALRRRRTFRDAAARGRLGHIANLSCRRTGCWRRRMSRRKSSSPRSVAFGFENDCVTIQSRIDPAGPGAEQVHQVQPEVHSDHGIDPGDWIGRAAGRRAQQLTPMAAGMLLDGHVRIEVLKDLGIEHVECLVSTDDEAFTYNKRISRLAPIQEHRMILKAIERGVSEEKIAPRSISIRAAFAQGQACSTASAQKPSRSSRTSLHRRPSSMSAQDEPCPPDRSGRAAGERQQLLRSLHLCDPCRHTPGAVGRDEQAKAHERNYA